MPEIVIALLALYIGWRMGSRLQAAPSPQPQSQPVPTDGEAEPTTSSEEPSATESKSSFPWSDELNKRWEASAHPSELLEGKVWQVAVDDLKQAPLTVRTGYITGDNYALAALSLEACRTIGHEEGIEDTFRNNVINHPVHWVRFFGLRAIEACLPEDQSRLHFILSHANGSWGYSVSPQLLSDAVKRLIEGGDAVDFAQITWLDDEERREEFDDLLDVLGAPERKAIRDQLETFLSNRLNLTYLKKVGRIWSTKELDERTYEVDDWSTFLSTLSAAPTQSSARSIIISGPTGCGKSALIRLAARRWRDDGWSIFQCGAAELMSGQIYIGQLEQRVQTLLKEIERRRKVIWYIPEIEQLAWAGRHKENKTSVLEMLLPHLSSGALWVVAETRTEGIQALLKRVPRLANIFELVRLDGLSPEHSSEIARSWLTDALPDWDTEEMASTLDDLLHLTGQYLHGSHHPGQLMHVLKTTWARIRHDAPSASGFTVDDALDSVSELTGLPRDILDERKPLELGELRGHFGQRVFGQPDAVNTLVNRVAMVKAGITDPTRPLGVFLFAGPTGTGKTEIAKALADYLFGSPERMIRLDMSELQTPESTSRLFGYGDGESSDGSLITRIREQPFSVVLLDEFEKAHSRVWDLFLQVFDDGRLTDPQGKIADFTHAIIIMTSNLGATIPTGLGLGFGGGNQHFSVQAVHKELGRSFRREFLNRIDETVVFRPLTRDTMRQLLRRELDQVFKRRGLRSRGWAVIYDDTALEFLLKEGFTPDLGARPLKRAIERHLLAPLAQTIVGREFPTGDQFLLLTSDGPSLKVEFVDPDAPTPPAEQDEESAESLAGDGPTLERMILQPRGNSDEAQVLAGYLRDLEKTLASEDWEHDKTERMLTMSATGFWQGDERFSILSTIELTDRIESAFRGANRIHNKLHGQGKRKQYQPDLIRRMAQQIWLIQLGLEDLREATPQDAFLEILPTDPNLAAPEFMNALASMYEKWAKIRNMRLTPINPSRTETSRLFAISGFGAWRLLQGESGIHVLEQPRKNSNSGESDKLTITVQVAPQPDHPIEDSSIVQVARSLLDESRTTNIVRRYRHDPSPLVKDLVRQWKTGRIDWIFGGNFDVMSKRESKS